VLDGDQKVRRVFGQTGLGQVVRPEQLEDRAELVSRGKTNTKRAVRGRFSARRYPMAAWRPRITDNG
jgi:hypothetical protein